MKKLHTFDFTDRLHAGMYQQLLAAEGIECLLRNEQLATALGEIPFIECSPELWVVDADIWPRARLLLDGLLKIVEPSLTPWKCTDCGEELPGQFGACWSCGSLRQ